MSTRDEIAWHLAKAKGYARFEILTALTAPHRGIINVLNRRVEDLQQLDDLVQEQKLFDKGWGEF